ncbi:hypothetical protein U0070_015331 [Myodes glareolus]|uniref:Uncharacterized protein n=1 Tax=Myodes glareolus TaxID=447135 RepID=A0AAW0K135_MYOGA
MYNEVSITRRKLDRDHKELPERGATSPQGELRSGPYVGVFKGPRFWMRQLRKVSSRCLDL